LDTTSRKHAKQEEKGQKIKKKRRKKRNESGKLFLIATILRQEKGN